MGKSLSSDSARARSQKQQKEAWRHAAPCSAGRAGAHPYRRRAVSVCIVFAGLTSHISLVLE